MSRHDQAGPPARRHPQDRHVVPPGRAVPQPADASSRRGILYPADRFDAHFLAALDLMQLPWGGLEAEAHGAWDRMAARGPGRGRGTADHQPRDPGHRLRAQVARALVVAGAPGHRGAPGPVGARPGPPDPGGVAGERQASPRLQLPRVPRDDPGSGSARAPVATWFWGVQEIPDILEPVGRRPAARARPPGDGARSRRAARRAVGAVLRGVRASPGSTSTARASGPTRPSAPPRPRWCAGSTSRPTAWSRPGATGRWSGSCWPTRRCPGARDRRG